jgi:hypothetical protein
MKIEEYFTKVDEQLRWMKEHPDKVKWNYQDAGGITDNWSILIDFPFRSMARVLRESGKFERYNLFRMSQRGEKDLVSYRYWYCSEVLGAISLNIDNLVCDLDKPEFNRYNASLVLHPKGYWVGEGEDKIIIPGMEHWQDAMVHVARETVGTLQNRDIPFCVPETGGISSGAIHWANGESKT